jgi:hypothetical protein
MTKFMGLSRLAVALLCAFAMVGTWGALTLSDAFGAGSPGQSRAVALFKDNGNKGGNGNGNAGGNGNGNGHGKEKAKDQDEVAADEEEGDAAFCSDVDAMLEYLEGKNNNGAAHANKKGADNAAAGRLNSCMEHAPNGENAQGEGDTNGDVTVVVDVDEDGNGKIEYDLDGDCKVDFTDEVGDGPADEPTAEATSEPTAEATGTVEADEELMDGCEVDDDEEAEADSDDDGSDSEDSDDSEEESDEAES